MPVWRQHLLQQFAQALAPFSFAHRLSADAMTSTPATRQPIPGTDFEVDNKLTHEVKSTVQGLIDEAMSKGTYIPYWESMVRALEQAGLAHRTHIPAELVGVHKENRSAFGYAGPEVQEHGRKILAA